MFVAIRFAAEGVKNGSVERNTLWRILLSNGQELTPGVQLIRVAQSVGEILVAKIETASKLVGGLYTQTGNRGHAWRGGNQQRGGDCECADFARR